MTVAMAIRSFAEFFVIILLVVGFWHEKKVIAFEEKLFRAIRIRVRRYRRRKALENIQSRGQSRAPASQHEAFCPVTVVRGKKQVSRVA